MSCGRRFSFARSGSLRPSQSRHLIPGPVSSLTQAFRNKACNISRNKGCLNHAEVTGPAGADGLALTPPEPPPRRCDPRRNHGPITSDGGMPMRRKRLKKITLIKTLHRKKKDKYKMAATAERGQRRCCLLVNFDRKCNLCPVFFVCVYVCVA